MKPWVIRSTEGLLGAALPHNKSHSKKNEPTTSKIRNYQLINAWSVCLLSCCVTFHPPPFARPKKTVNRGCNVEERRRTDESRRFKTWRRTRRKGVLLIWSNMNCRKVLATISITWHPFFSLPLSYSASISILPWKRESQLTPSRFLPWDSVISLPAFQSQFQCPPLASELNNIGKASKASLSLSLSLCPSPYSLAIFNFRFLNFNFSFSRLKWDQMTK